MLQVFAPDAAGPDASLPAPIVPDAALSITAQPDTALPEASEPEIATTDPAAPETTATINREVVEPVSSSRPTTNDLSETDEPSSTEEPSESNDFVKSVEEFLATPDPETEEVVRPAKRPRRSTASKPKPEFTLDDEISVLPLAPIADN